jgi:hypothetical protein
MSKRTVTTYKVWVHIEEFRNGEPLADEADEPHSAGEYDTLEAAQEARDAMIEGVEA